MTQTELLRRLADVFDDLGIRYAIVGSIASMMYGMTRMTQDIDVLADIPLGKIRPLCEEFGPPEYYVSLEAAIDAVRRGSQFNIIHPASGNKIDVIARPPTAWGDEQLSEVRQMPLFPDRQICVAPPEQVIIAKMMAYDEGGSEKHLRDIAGMLRQPDAVVDRGYIERWANQLGLTAIWESILRRLSKA